MIVVFFVKSFKVFLWVVIFVLSVFLVFLKLIGSENGLILGSFNSLLLIMILNGCLSCLVSDKIVRLLLIL